MGYNTDDPQEIHRGLSGKPPQEYQRGRRSGSKKDQRKQARNNKDDGGNTLPLASPRAIHVAEGFLAAAEDYGYALPYNANWLAHQIAKKVDHDPEMQKELKLDRYDDVTRWLDKMTDRYWAEYVNDSIKPKNVLFDYLDDSWEDLRYYAMSCLRAAWAVKYGKWKEPKEYGDHRETQLYKDLKRIRFEANLEHAMEVSKEMEDDHRDHQAIHEQNKAKIRAWKAKRDTKLLEEKNALPTSK